MSSASPGVGAIGPADAIVSPVEETSRPIVSVNEGPRRRFPWAFYGLLVVAFFAVAGLLFWAASKVKPANMVPVQMVSTKPAGTPIDARGTFADKPLVPTSSSEVSAAPTQSVAVQRHCADRPILGPDQKPILGADGRPLMVTCDGRSASAPRGTPTVSIGPTVSAVAGGAGAGPAAGQIPALADRYGGDVIIAPAPVASGARSQLPAPPEEAMALIRRAEEAGVLAAATQQRQVPAGASQSTRPDLLRDPNAGMPPAPPRAGSESEHARETRRDRAQRLEARRFVAVRGTQIECFLSLAYVSDIAGEAHCVVARDVYGHDGSTILIERGATVNGTFRSTTSVGERRAHVIWDRLITPSGIVVTFSAKGTDALGGTGLPAEVDNRWVDRLGLAVAVSAIRDITTAAAARRAASQSASQMVSSAQNFGDTVLQQTVGIRPSLYVQQGSAASIVLQSDLDFSTVHALRR